eukprot:463719-Prorocentrum_minimum.AAC.2
MPVSMWREAALSFRGINMPGHHVHYAPVSARHQLNHSLQSFCHLPSLVIYRYEGSWPAVLLEQKYP